ncbi:hypothetical protein KSP39_PZI003584 [Platanthera zijinensis]|uniref:Uncharacterized protein n=1 Tax=Platanthera zijinensis TaxID=2320716 RepID=A0AAP0BX08_9ASPA
MDFFYLEKDSLQNSSGNVMEDREPYFPKLLLWMKIHLFLQKQIVFENIYLFRQICRSFLFITLLHANDLSSSHLDPANHSSIVIVGNKGIPSRLMSSSSQHLFCRLPPSSLTPS